MSLTTLSGIKLPIGKDEKSLVKLAEKRLGKKPAYFAIRKKSLDARDKGNLHYLYTIEFGDEQPQKKEALACLPKSRLPEKPVLIVGSGPAGLFCALRLLERGIPSIVVERGPCVEERAKKIERFCLERVLDLNGNVQFGEGGAGTFSDGKLNTQTHSPYNREVLETFVRFGAPQEILWLQKPHIGSDNLKKVVRNMREYLINHGGQARFDSLLTDVSIQDGQLRWAAVKDLKSGVEERIEPSVLVLAIGHSARDTFEMLLARGVTMRQKDFAVGVRIEHLQSAIGLAQYGKAYTQLPAADYKLVSHAHERSAFTFCMCPGGVVMPAASEEGGVVTNGMSNFARDERNANAALIAQVRGADFGSEHPLAGVEFQRKLERAAFVTAGSDYRAPAQRVGDFLQGKTSAAWGDVLPSYAAGTAFADLNGVLPLGVCESLKAAIVDMDRKLKGFACPDAVLTGVETRTSSPVRIERGEDLQSVSAKGLFPCGEGAGYAGGITSAAADGLRVAEKLFTLFGGENC
ncbi:MAG: FAD-dependent monooxygenase [Clostridia bacterium]|nr:FAD-dependent monooxygenase [Clostridia bacterium]